MTTYTTPRATGLPTLGALAVIVVVALIGAGIDLMTGPGLRRGFAVGLVIGSVLAALLVRPRGSYAVAVAPPLINLIGQAGYTLLSGAGMGSKTQIASQASNWLVNGFPEMAAATLLAIVIGVARYLGRR